MRTVEVTRSTAGPAPVRTRRGQASQAIRSDLRRRGYYGLDPLLLAVCGLIGVKNGRMLRSAATHQEREMSEAGAQSAVAGAIVVGVDGSDGSRAALEYALDEGARRQLSVRAVMAYEPPYLWVTPKGLVPDARELHRGAKEEASRLVESVTSARQERGDTVPPVEVEVYSGPPSAVLERLSKDAALLVVGNRGRGGTASRFIGSVGLNSVVRAACTVIVVRS